MTFVPDDILLGGKTAFVTAGASGIGQGIALNLARFGADIAIVDIDAEASRKTAEEIRRLGRRACLVTANVLDEGALEAAIQTAASELGKISILINNAGGARVARFLDVSQRSCNRQIAMNLTTMFDATRAAARLMIDKGEGGSIINIGTIEALRAAPNYSVYAACKAAMLNFTKTMALELSEYGIRVNAIIPDVVMTDGLKKVNQSINDADVAASRHNYIPLGRDGDIDDCAGAAVFLSSNMARYITGAILNVDGGTSAAAGWTRDPLGDWRLFP